MNELKTPERKLTNLQREKLAFFIGRYFRTRPDGIPPDGWEALKGGGLETIPEEWVRALIHEYRIVESIILT